jgi:mRNA interferase MazF
MTTRSLKIGNIVVTARFPEQKPQGREQEGYRPAIIVGFPNLLGKLRFPVIIVVPMTSYRNQSWADNAPQLYPLYPVFPAGIAGLKSSSIALFGRLLLLRYLRELRQLLLHGFVYLIYTKFLIPEIYCQFDLGNLRYGNY